VYTVEDDFFWHGKMAKFNFCITLELNSDKVPFMFCANIAIAQGFIQG